MPVLLALSFYLHAQTQESESSGNAPPPLSANANALAEAIALYNAGKSAEAQALLVTLPKDDPDFAAAERYRALCLHDLKDYHGFMKAIESADIRAAVVPPGIVEKLAFNQIDCLFFFRKFEDIFPAIQSFQNSHPDSVHLGAVTEYKLAALFERGLKKTLEACRLKDETQFNRRWSEGKANLQQFLSLTHTSSLTGYTILTNRSLREDVWAARFILGDGPTVLEELPGQDVASREKFGLLRILLYPKLQPDHPDENLRRMEDFLKDFPESRSRPKVKFEMANIALIEGERLVSEARRTPDAEAAAAMKTSAASYLNTAWAIFNGVAEDKEAGIGAGEMRESREGLLRIFYAKGDWENLSAWAAQLLSNSPEEKEWLVIKLYFGAGLVRQQKLSEAAKVFDEVLSIGFRNTPSYDGLLVAAAGWRISVAKQSGDETTVRQTVDLVQSSNCEDSIKRTFMKKFGTLAIQPNPASK